jgi:hypothetical protein
MTPTVPQLRLPLQLDPGTGDLAVIAEGSALDNAQRVAVLLSTPRGWFDAAPDFGLSEQAHREGGPDLAEIDRQISTYVPEADQLATEDLSMLNDALALIGVRVTGS